MQLQLPTGTELGNKRKRQFSNRKNKKLSEKKSRDDLKIEEIENNSTSDSQIKDGDGSGYMGWSVNDKEKEKGFELKGAFEEINSLFQLYQGMELKIQGSVKQINNLKKDIKDLKEEYKQCLDTLSRETYERNKAEAENKALRETLEVERKMKLLMRICL